MKRILLIALMLMLLTLPACAEIWFPDGHTLHRDPICVKNSFTADSCYEKVLILSQEELETGDYLPCTHCCAYASPAPEVTADGPVTWYQNAQGGSYLHLDPFCSTVSKKYQPMTPVDELPAGIIPTNACNICTRKSGHINYLFDNMVWNATPEARAELLPGVWTMPDANAYPMEHAVAVAKEIAATYSNKTVHSAFALHYDCDDWGTPRKTWRVVVTTTLLHPVCVVNIDATTGEYISTHVAKFFSDIMLLDDPEKLELAVAEGTKIELLANQVNFRNKPKGGDITDSIVITHFDKGNTLTLLGEKRCGMKLWYYVSSPKHGNGYVDSNFAQIIHSGQKRGSSALSDNLLTYLTELRRWQLENGFLALDANGQYAYTRDEALNTEHYCDELVALMHKHSITATVGGTSPFILANHYGTANLWEIFDPTTEIIPGLHVDDWHSPDFPTETEQKKLADALAAVDAEYR